MSCPKALFLAVSVAASIVSIVHTQSSNLHRHGLICDKVSAWLLSRTLVELLRHNSFLFRILIWV